MARQKSSGAAAPLQLIPAGTAFDFLEGAFRASQRARQVFLSVALVAVAAVGALILLGVSATVGTSEDSSRLNDLAGQLAQRNAQIQQHGGQVATPAMAADIAARKAAAKEAAGGEVDVPALLQALEQAAPAGVQVTGVTIGSTANTAPTAGQATSSAGKAVPAERKVTLTAKVTSLSDVQSLQDALSRVPLLKHPTAKWSGSVPAVTVTVTAAVADSALTARAQQINAAAAAGSAGGK